MSSTKCSKCGLSNFESDEKCRRCGSLLYRSSRVLREKPAKRFSLISLVIYAALIVGGYYLYQNMKQSMEAVNKDDVYRVGSQPAQKPAQQGLTRNEADRQHANQVGNSIKENPSFAAQKQHDEDTKRAMQQVSNTQQ